MQLTRFDRWLLRCFVYETHIHTLSDPGPLPRGIRRINEQETPGQRYNHHFVTRSEKTAERFTSKLKAANQMFTTRIVNRRAWYTGLIATKGKSFSWKCAWLVVAGGSVYWIGSLVTDLWANPEFRRHFLDAIEVLKR